jgi:hypothetical protein
MKAKTTQKKAAKGREHTIAKSMPPRRERKAERIASADDLDAQRVRNAGTTTAEPPVELLIDAKGIHSLTAGARPAAKGTKGSAPKPKPAEVVPEAPDDAEELVVFAFRLTRAERDLIHAAAGPAKASSFVKTLAVAAAKGDAPTVMGILDTIYAAMK